MSDPDEDGERHGALIDALRAAILYAPGATGADDRTRAAAGEAPSGPLGDYVEKMRSASYRIVDADIEALLDEGMSQDAVLELTLATALGEAQRRRGAVVEALRGTQAG